MAEPVPPKPAARPLVVDTLAGSVAVLLVVNIIQRSVGFGRGILFCRWLSPEALGNWEMAYGFLLLAAPLAVLGLPGSFGRYLERYRERGQLRSFLTRTAIWSFVLSTLTIATIVVERERFAWLIFGDSREAPLVVWVAVCLALVIVHHFLEAVFAGLRLFRVVSAMQFCHSMGFAVLALTLLYFWRDAAGSIVVGYGAACLISIVGVLLWSLQRVERTGTIAPPIPHSEFWPPLMQFAIWVWVANLLSNLFAVVDRYMIVHFSGMSSQVALAQVGNYHTSNILPMLLVSVANLLVGAVTPHLSYDWEQGRREHVSTRLNLVLKLTSLGMLAAGIGILVLCPVLFRVAFENKYADGLAVLPWALVASVWFSLLLVAQTYVWCAEQTWRAAWPMVWGLLANVVLNLLWLPKWGLWGAVVATACATCLALVIQLVVNRRCGMRICRGTWLACVVPLALAAGTIPAGICLLLILLTSVTTNVVLTVEERSALANLLQRRVNRSRDLATSASEFQIPNPQSAI
ncbi:MAG: lipopolysaccharide biosynthesis protein [Pirellulales bacterium]